MASTPEERKAVPQQWGSWFGTLGSAVLEQGKPFGASATVSADGVAPGASAGGGTVQVFEALEM